MCPRSFFFLCKKKKKKKIIKKNILITLDKARGLCYIMAMKGNNPDKKNKNERRERPKERMEDTTMTHEELRASMPGPEACLEDLKTTAPEEISRWFSISQEYYEFRASISANEAERAAWEACLEYINNPANREWWTI